MNTVKSDFFQLSLGQTNLSTNTEYFNEYIIKTDLPLNFADCFKYLPIEKMTELMLGFL